MQCDSSLNFTFENKNPVFHFPPQTSLSIPKPVRQGMDGAEAICAERLGKTLEQQ